MLILNGFKAKFKVNLAFSITILLWASAFPIIKIALQDFRGQNLAALRLLVASTILLVYAIIKKYPIPNWKDLPVILLLGFCGFTVYHIGLSYGELFISSGVASLLVSLTPIFSALLAKYFLKERFTIIGWLGSLIAFLGILFITFGEDEKLSVMIIGVVLTLLATIGESIYFTFQTKYLKKYGFIPLTVYTIIGSNIFTIIFIPNALFELGQANYFSIISVLYLGVFPTVLPYIALAYTIQKVGVSDATISLYLTPVISIILAHLIIGESPTIISIVGGAITLLGVSTIVFKEKFWIVINNIKSNS